MQSIAAVLDDVDAYGIEGVCPRHRISIKLFLQLKESYASNVPHRQAHIDKSRVLSAGAPNAEAEATETAQ